MNRHLPIFALLLFGLIGCDAAKSGKQSEAGLRDAVMNMQDVFAAGNAEKLAGLYTVAPNQTHEDNLSYAKTILKAELPWDHEVHGVSVSGNMGVVLLSSTESEAPLPLFARWEDGNWKFFRSLTLWGNTNKVEQFGLTEEEMENALKLQEWVTAEREKGEQEVAE